MNEAIQRAEHVLYRFHDSAGSLLYVGIAINFGARRGQHKIAKEWWGEVDESRTVTEVYDSRRGALIAEAAAIRNEAPRYNLATSSGTYLSAARLARIESARAAREDAEAEYREEVLAAMLHDGASFSEVSKATGLSTNTLQRWKREASA